MEDKNLERDLVLLDQIALGSKTATEELLCKYTPLVKHIIRKYVSGVLEFEDLLQEGLIGLLAAMDEYDYQTFGVKFSSFAYLCVTRRVFNVIRQSNNSKHKALNSAVSLQACPDDGRALMDVKVTQWSDPGETIEEKWTGIRLDQTLRSHLSALEYLVVSLLAKGYCMREIEISLGIPAKAVDNARTRAKLKIRRLMDKHGSLLASTVPSSGRRRLDLCMDVRLTAEV